MKLNSLEDLFVDGLKDVYSAEKQIMQALPKMARAVSDPMVQQAFQDHLKQTEQQKERLDRIFEQLGTTPGRKKCAGMEGILAEGEEMMKDSGTPAVVDAALIAAAQKVEHYEITAYGTLRTYAHTLGNDQAAKMLQQTLDEEAKTDEKLTALAERGPNVNAAHGTGTATGSARRTM